MWIEIEAMSGRKSLVNTENACFIWTDDDNKIWIDGNSYSFTDKESRDLKYEEIRGMLG